MDLFNVDIGDIDTFETSNQEDGSIQAVIRLRRTVRYCPRCGTNLISNGVSRKVINHKALNDRNMSLIYKANRYRCSRCNYSEYEKNPFSLKGFSQSILTVNQLMIDLHDPRYNYTILAQKYNMSVNEVILYLDSYVVLPHIPLPENLGIDEIYSGMAKRKQASYLGILVDNDDFALVEILPSRSKYDLNAFFSLRSREEREKVKYVTSDMWEPYKAMALKWLPNCTVILSTSI